MSINQSDIIDLISTNSQNQVLLTISDHHSWDEIWHLRLLEDKINAYLRFIESGQVFTDYPKANGKEIIIRITMKYQPNKDADSFLKKAKEIISNAGFRLEWEILNSKD